MNKTLIKIDRNGSKHYEGMVPCDRCGGRGFWEGWRATGQTCWKCGGTGTVFATWIERTPEYEAVLEKRRQARAEKAQAERDAELAKDEEARRQRELAEKLAKEQAEREKALEEARKAISQHVGEVGEKLTVNGAYDHSAWYTVTMFGMDETRFVHTFKDTDGNVFVWKTSKYVNLTNGEPVVLRGTVKEHSTYDGEKQTVLLRVKIERVGA